MAFAVLVRDLCWIETIDGLLDSGGDGNPGTAMTCGLSDGALELVATGVGAIEGDCNGDCIGASSRRCSVKIGGSSGVVA